MHCEPLSGFSPARGAVPNMSEDEEGKLPLAFRPRSMDCFKFLNMSRDRFLRFSNKQPNDHISASISTANLKEGDPIVADPVRVSSKVKLIKNLRSKYEGRRSILTSRNGSKSKLPKTLKLESEKGKDHTCSDCSKLSNTEWKNESILKHVRGPSYGREQREHQTFSILPAEEERLPSLFSKILLFNNVSHNISKMSDYFPINSYHSSNAKSNTLLVKQQTNSQQPETVQNEDGTIKRADTIVNLNQVLNQIPEIKHFYQERVKKRRLQIRAQICEALGESSLAAAVLEPLPKKGLMVLRPTISSVNQNIFS